MASRRKLSWLMLVCLLLPVVVLIGSAQLAAPGEDADPGAAERSDQMEPVEVGQPPNGVVTLAFAGDIHFERHLRALLGRRPSAALGPILRPLGDADLTMVNLESAITMRGTPEPKDYHFRTTPAALDLLAGAGVDMVSLANNHAIDYGRIGLGDTLAAARTSPIPVLGIGEDEAAAYRAHEVEVRGTDIAFLAATSEPERALAWAAGPDRAGIATALDTAPQKLLAAVRTAASDNDVVVVYLHWGKELQACPTDAQLTIAQLLEQAGADVVVGTHAHVLLGSGWLGRTYVNYGLGNFIWYHDVRKETGVLTVRIEDGDVVSDSWAPARIQPSGVPLPLAGGVAEAARRDWRQLAGCAGLAAQPAR